MTKKKASSKPQNSSLVEATAQVELDLPLTKEGVEKAADGAASLMHELDTKEERYKLVKREWNADIKNLKIRQREFLANYAKKSACREVECKVVYDLKGKKTWYEFEGAKYKVRELNDYEMAQAKQKGLFNDGPDLPGVVHENKGSGEAFDPLPAASGDDGAGNVIEGPF